MLYEELLSLADQEGLIVREKDLIDNDGRIKNDRVAIRRDMTTVRKACTLAEELGHHFTTVGDILDQSDVSNRKQEAKARLWSYEMMIGLDGLIRAFEHGCRNRYEIAEYLDVTEELLQEAVDRWERIYGTGWIRHGQYLVSFANRISIIRIFSNEKDRHSGHYDGQ